VARIEEAEDCIEGLNAKVNKSFKILINLKAKIQFLKNHLKMSKTVKIECLETF